MELTYKKNNNKELFESLENEELLSCEACQNYIPIYDYFFKLNENNFNNINLNQNYSLFNINEKINNNEFSGKLLDEENKIIETNVFFKLSPLVDPTKYLIGKYNINDIFKLPKLTKNLAFEKIEKKKGLN